MLRPQSSSFSYSESRIMVPISIQNFCLDLPEPFHLKTNDKKLLRAAWIGRNQRRIRVLATVSMSAVDLSNSFITLNAECYTDGGFSTQHIPDNGRTLHIGMVGTSPFTRFNTACTMSQYKPLAERGLELLIETVECTFPHESSQNTGFSMNIQKMGTELNEDNDRGALPSEGRKDHVEESRKDIDGSMIVDESISHEKENLRRQRISEANRGRVPWNKGRQHSEETKKRIRETVIKKMRDPEMREKLRIQAKAVKSRPEVMLKIRTGIRNAWKEKRRIRAIQETCVVEWKEMIAEYARIGNDGDEVYQWDSYTIIKQKLRSAFNATQRQIRKNMAQRRNALSDEHKLRISKTIKEKWADPVYRDTVQKGLEGAVKRRTKEDTQLPGANWHSQIASYGMPSKNLRAPKPAIDIPAYKDSEIKSKLEKLKSIRAYRLAVEGMRRRDITERARVLIAQAEEAAKALEAAAKKDKSALAPLLETRRLLAEAMQSIASASCGNDMKLLESEDENQAV